MPFDLKKFNKAKFQPRTETVPVSGLADFFAKDEKAQFTVRGLTGEEMARANDAQSRQKNLAAVVEALAGEDGTEKIKAIRESLGLSDDDVPADLARRIELVRMGCVEPEGLDIQAAAKIFKVAPVDGFALSNRILMLSGQGMILGEQKASGKTKESKQPAT